MIRPLTPLLLLAVCTACLRAEVLSDSPWYLEREPRRALEPAGEVGASELPAGLPSVLPDLEALLRDGGVPGFYDGQFAVTADRFDELVAVARDTDLHHVLRIMAVMALQEAERSPRLEEALRPLLLPPQLEWQVDYAQQYRQAGGNAVPDEATTRAELDVDLSRHARFALAKGGYPEAILERIRLLEEKVEPLRDEILDPEAPYWSVFIYRSTWFSIAYHYQQFDDYENAARWFRDLTENLRGSDSRWAHYNLACLNALQGRPEEAVAELAGAIEDGFADLAWMDEDGDLASLRGRADFQALRTELGATSEFSNAAPVDSAGGP